MNPIPQISQDKKIEDERLMRVAIKIMNDAFFMGVYPGLTKPMLDHMVNSLREVLEPASMGKTVRVAMPQILGAA